MQQNMITIRNLSKEFKGQSVLKNITMEMLSCE
jgi:ABC-type polar amino acid transport system ATPase subunit